MPQNVQLKKKTLTAPKNDVSHVCAQPKQCQNRPYRAKEEEEELKKMLHNENGIFLRTFFDFCAGFVSFVRSTHSLSLRLAIAPDAYYYSVCKVNYNVDVTFQERK